MLAVSYTFLGGLGIAVSYLSFRMLLLVRFDAMSHFLFFSLLLSGLGRLPALHAIPIAHDELHLGGNEQSHVSHRDQSLTSITTKDSSLCCRCFLIHSMAIFGSSRFPLSPVIFGNKRLFSE